MQPATGSTGLPRQNMAQTLKPGRQPNTCITVSRPTKTSDTPKKTRSLFVTTVTDIAPATAGRIEIVNSKRHLMTFGIS